MNVMTYGWGRVIKVVLSWPLALSLSLSRSLSLFLSPSTQVADGIRYLHSLYIVHRDIKPSNVLIWSLHPDRGVDVKLADYGVSQFNAPGGLHRQRGTEEYMAPELFHQHSSVAYDEKVILVNSFSCCYFSVIIQHFASRLTVFWDPTNKK